MNAACPACHAPTDPGIRYCEQCGEPIPDSRPAPRKAPCPKCTSADHSYTAEEYLALKFTKADIEKADEQDKTDPEGVQLFYLTKPERPAPPNIRGWLMLPWIPLANFAFMWFAPMDRGFKAVLAGMVTVFAACVIMPELYAHDLYAFVGCFIILIYYAGLLIGRDRRSIDYLTRELPAYEAAAARWQHLRYCQHCEICWLDNDPSRTTPVEETDAFLENPDRANQPKETPAQQQPGAARVLLIFLASLAITGGIALQLHNIFKQPAAATLPEASRPISTIIDDIQPDPISTPDLDRPLIPKNGRE